MSSLIHCDFKGKTWISDRKLKQEYLESKTRLSSIQYAGNSGILPMPAGATREYVPYGGAGIDGMYLAPDKDPA